MKKSFPYTPTPLFQVRSQEKRPASHSWSVNIHSRCLLNRVKAPLRVPKTQRATFLNNIVTANTVFLEKFTKKRCRQRNSPLSL